MPVAKTADIVPAVEDRSYLAFIVGAMAAAVLGGFTLAIVLSLAEAGVFWEDRAPWLVQAHGWAQLQGWAGLFVAGMGLRLLPRFAGRKPLLRAANIVIFVLLFAGVLVRTVAQVTGSGDLAAAGLLAGSLLWAAGAATFSVTLGLTLLRGRGRGQAWHTFALAGAAGWLAWAVLALAAGVRGARNDGYVPSTLDDTMTWVVLLGAVGNFIWAVQGRSVPIFFGRKTPPLRGVAVPFALLNFGVGCLFLAAWLDPGAGRERLAGAGFVSAGAALAWLAPVAGSVWGTATRLRPRARSAARFVLFANWAAVVCGLLLLWAGAESVYEGAHAAPGVRDAARHAFGVGLVTLLIVGMAQLVAPFFALQRMESRADTIIERAILVLLAGAAVLRVTSALLLGHMDGDARMHLSATAGVLALVGLVLFGITVARALRDEPGIKAGLLAAAVESRRRNQGAGNS